MAAVNPGAAFGPYRIIEPLGRGGMATVYRAYEATLDRYVALKVLPAEFLHEETFAARFRREAKVVAKLEHPNIVPIFAFGIEAGIPWMSMRLIGGGNLAGALKKGRLERRRVAALVRSAADALTYAHAQGVVHRDVKPQNILLDEHDRLYLADFGIARMVEGGAAITRTGLVSGTPQYMAPEQATGQAVDHRADIYALGVVAYEMLTGSVPFSADTPVAVLLKHVSGAIPIPAAEDVPEGLLGPLMKSLAKDPGERWQTAADFASALEAGMGDAITATVPAVAAQVAPTLRSTVAVPTTSEGSRLPQTETGKRSGAAVLALALVAVVCGLLIATAVAGYWLWHRSTGPNAVPVASMESGDPTPQPEAVSPEQVPGGDPTPTGVEEAAAPVSLPLPPPAQASSRPSPQSERTAPLTISSPHAVGARPALQSHTAATPPPMASTPANTVVESPAAVPPGGHAFRLNEALDVGSPVIGPVLLRRVRFWTPKAGQLEAQLSFECAEGKDQIVGFEITLLDEDGQILRVLKERKDLEETDKKTFKVRTDFPSSSAVRYFRVSFTSVPD